MDDLQCSRKLENAWFGLVLLVEMARRRLRYLPSPENASMIDFDLKLFSGFCNFGSHSITALQPWFLCLSLPYVLYNTFGQNSFSKSPSINALDVDLICFYKLSKLAWFQSLCALMPWYEFGMVQAVHWNLYPSKDLWLSIFLNLCDFIWFKMN